MLCGWRLADEVAAISTPPAFPKKHTLHQPLWSNIKVGECERQSEQKNNKNNIQKMNNKVIFMTVLGPGMQEYVFALYTHTHTHLSLCVGSMLFITCAICINEYRGRCEKIVETSPNKACACIYIPVVVVVVVVEEEEVEVEIPQRQECACGERE